jgi:hypothetical protein
MDLYSNPPESLYQLGITKWFQMPENDYTIPAVAVPKDEGDLWNSGYTLLITVMFAAIGKLVTDLVISLFPLRSNGNRAAMLVTYYNTGDLVTSTFLMASYARKIYFRVRKDEGVRDWGTFILALMLFSLSLSLFTASLAAGLLIPTNLLMGTMARVSPGAIFYFERPLGSDLVNEASSNPDSRDQAVELLFEALQRFNHHAATRAYGTVEQNRRAIEEKTNFNYIELPVTNGNRGFKFEYGWEITGLDLGLQRDPELKQTVTGECETQFDWYNEEKSTSELDYYTLFKGTTYEFPVGPRLNGAVHPKASFILAEAEELVEGEQVFAIVPQFAGRLSVHAMENDLWYSTDRTNETGSDAGPQYIIRRSPPALLCTEKLLWEYHNLVVPTNQLEKAAQIGMKLSKFWWNKVFTREFGDAPKTLQIGRSLATLSLGSLSQGFTENNFINTPVANSTGDFRDWILTSYVGSREAIRNTALLQVDRTGLENLATYDDDGNPTGKPVPDELADFVLESSEVTTLSLRVMLSIPCIFLVLWFIVGIRRHIFNLNGMAANNTSKRSKFVARSAGLSAVQLYRFLDEEICGKRRWDGRMSDTPFIADISVNQNVPEKCLKGQSPFDVIPVSAQYSEEKGLLNVEHVPRQKYDSVIREDWAQYRKELKEEEKTEKSADPQEPSPAAAGPSLNTPPSPSPVASPAITAPPATRPPVNRPPTTVAAGAAVPAAATSDTPPPASTPPESAHKDLEDPPAACYPVVDNFIVPKLVPMYHISPEEEPAPVSPGVSRTNSFQYFGLNPQRTNSVASMSTHRHRGWPRPSSPPLSPLEYPEEPEWDKMSPQEQEDWKRLAKSMQTRKKMVPIPDRYELSMTYVYRPQLKATTDRLNWSMVQEDAVSCVFAWDGACAVLISDTGITGGCFK